MSFVAVRAKVLRWGNSFGLRLSRRDIDRLHLRPGQEVNVNVDVDEDTINVDDLPVFHMGSRAADEHDALFESDVAEDAGGRTR